MIESPHFHFCLTEGAFQQLKWISQEALNEFSTTALLSLQVNDDKYGLTVGFYDLNLAERDQYIESDGIYIYKYITLNHIEILSNRYVDYIGGHFLLMSYPTIKTLIKIIMF